MSCPRLAAAQCLTAVANGQSLNRQLPVNEQSLPNQQRPLYRELCYGVLRHYWTLKAALKPCFAKPLKRKDLDIEMLVLVGAYQLRYTAVAPHAAINSCVEACRTVKKKWAAGMVNAILRRCQRDGDELFSNLPAAAATGHPQWLYQAILQAWPQQAEAILAANNSHPPMCLRVNARHGDRDSYLQTLNDAEIDASPCSFAPRGLRLHTPQPVSRLPGFAEGAASVQDEAAQLCTTLLELGPGQRVLDACAAPGGKTGAILEAEAELAEVVALDVEASRLDSVSDNLNRLGLEATLLCADAADTASWWDGRPFDRILLDAPCSATGVIRRNPDIKLHRRADDIAPLVALQRRILDALWQCLSPGGTLLYATCSVLPEENEQQVADFLTRHNDAAEVPIEATWGQARPVGRQLFPAVDGPDGFFYARLDKS